MKRARPYHKRWHGNALNGMRGLTLEERGAYNTLMDLMYDRQGAWPDDERRTCGELDCDPRVWRRVRASLQSKGKIAIHDGLIYARRVHDELGTSAELPAEVREKFAIATQQLPATSDEKPKENNPPPKENSQKSDLLFHSPESITPIVPKGTSPGLVDRSVVEEIWLLAGKVSRERSSKADVKRALEAAYRRGKAHPDIVAGLRGYFASDGATKDNGAFAKGVHRMIEGDRWESFAEAAPAAILFDPKTAAPPDDPWRKRVREFAKNGFWNRVEWGSAAPSRPGCAAPAEIQREFGFEPAAPIAIPGAAA
jgi:uncharacterized protein YdaU (DUF1376 family)